jgi:uncharacterized membrane protein (UPF0127 family)
MTVFTRHGYILILVLIGLVSCQSQARTKYDLVIKGKTVTVEIAATDEARTRGLMYREALAPDSGMLFIFSGEEQYLNFWMKNTSIPLVIAFIKADGIISEIRPMQPFSEETIASQEPVKYALEMEQGWFKLHNIKAGGKVYLSQEIKNINVE